MLIAMSLLALLGLRYPLRMLPILLFEVGWKLLWLGVVALPLWADDKLEGATREQTGTVLWVVIIIAVIPWSHVSRSTSLRPATPGVGAGSPAHVSAQRLTPEALDIRRTREDRTPFWELDRGLLDLDLIAVDQTLATAQKTVDTAPAERIRQTLVGTPALRTTTSPPA